MPDIHQRVIRCFQALFPDLSESEASGASVLRTAGWDSVATVTLAATLEEEFGIQFEPEEVERMSSFGSCLDLVRSRAS